jgi:hypothetical protein
MKNIRILVTNDCNSQILKSKKKSSGICGFCYRQTNKIKSNRKTIIKILEEIKALKKEYPKLNMFFQSSNADGPKRIWICADGKIFTQKKGGSKNIEIGDIKISSLKKFIT